MNNGGPNKDRTKGKNVSYLAASAKRIRLRVDLVS